MKYGAWSFPLGTAVIATGGRHDAGFASGDAQESCPCAKPEANLWSAAMVASTALFGTLGAIAVPPTVPKRPPWNVCTYGGFMPIRSATVPGKRSLNTPNPLLSTVFGSICHAIAVLGCRIANGVDEKRFPRCVWMAALSGWLTSCEMEE